MHVLVFAEIGRDFTDFRVELHVNVLLLAKQNCMLQQQQQQLRVNGHHIACA